ncbi:unnamed protein product [Bursaphelenchus okinawaensis]|uniref:Uncharacterized protein n=1 Tax=Bursaphelenchus okinawaensis TaxID=465554 RepID=A0A811JRA7_9BILA|nr:unnamed protein product [Bursaphelenchus okinawaensis]CAG9079935.1 unnamed protein product [Bursaphelenchus okinawaensis]
MASKRVNKLPNVNLPQTSYGSSVGPASPSSIPDRPKTSVSVLDVPPEFLIIQEEIQKKNRMKYWNFNLGKFALFALLLGTLITAGDVAVQIYFHGYYYAVLSTVTFFFYIFGIIGNQIGIRQIYVPQIVWNLIYLCVYVVLFLVQLLRYSPFHHKQNRQDVSLEKGGKLTEKVLEIRWEDRLYTAWVGIVVLTTVFAFKVVYRHFYVLETNEITGATETAEIIKDDVLNKLRMKLGKISEEDSVSSSGSK